MGAGYGYSLDSEAVAVLILCSRRERRLLVDACEKFARHPFFVGDFSQRGADGREYQVFDLGHFVMTCWTDHAEKNVRILAIERV